MAETKVAIRLGVDGAAQVRNDFASVATAGTAAMGQIATATDAAAAANDRYTQRQLDGFAKQAAAAKLAIVAQVRQASINDTLGVGGTVKSAAASYDVFKSIKPSLVEAEGEVEKLNAVLGLNRSQTIIAQSAVLRFVDTLIAGGSPIRAFALEAHKIPEVLSVDDGGMAGGLAKVTKLFSPFNLAVAAGTIAVVAGAVAAYEYAAAYDKLNAISQGSGRLIGATGGALQANAVAAAKAGHITVTAARDIESAYVNTGKIGLPILAGLVAATTDFAAATGTDVKTATATLAAAFADPVKGASELTERYGYLDQAQIKQIRRMADAGDALGAQKVLLDALAAGTAHAADNVSFFSRVWRNFTTDLGGKVDFVGATIDGLINGLPKLERLNQLLATRKFYVEQERLAPTNASVLAIDAQIAAQQKLVTAEQRKADAVKNTAVANSEAETARKAVASYSGDDKRAELDKTRAVLAKAVAAGHREDAESLDAYTHAVTSYLSPAALKQKIDEADVKIAAAKTPADKRAAAAAKERIEQSGKLATTAQVEADATAKGAAAAATASKAGEGHAETLKRQAAAMGVAATASLALATAYLAGGAAAIEAEARRKAATDATRKGIDVEAEVRRQLALDVAEGAAAGAKAAAGLGDEADVRAKLNALVEAGAINTDEANSRLKDEAALRPLLKLQTVAQGDALRVLTKVVDAYRDALGKAHDEEDRSAVDKIVESSKRTIEGLRDSAAIAGDRTGAGAIENARRTALRDAAARNFSPEQGSTVAAAAAAVEAAKQAGDRVKYLKDSLNSQRDAAEYARAELATLGLNAAKRGVILDTLKKEQELRGRGIGLADADARAILDGVKAEDQLKDAVARTQAAMSELTAIGGKLVDDVLNPSNWSSWGALGKSVLRDIEAEFIKLAAIDPLKNLLGLNGGTPLPTLGSVGGFLGKLLGGGGSASPIGLPTLAGFSAPSSAAFAAVPHFASGTDYFSGGSAIVGENGAEQINLPRGSSIANASATRRMLAGNDNAAPKHFYFDLRGAIVTQDVLDQMNAIGNGAATRGAFGGAQLAAIGDRKRRDSTLY